MFVTSSQYCIGMPHDPFMSTSNLVVVVHRLVSTKYEELLLLCRRYPTILAVLLLLVTVVYYERERQRQFPESWKIRLLQWNLLADGLGLDGFISTEVGPFYVDEQQGQNSYSAGEFLDLIRKAKIHDKEESDIPDLRRKLSKEQALLTKLDRLHAEKGKAQVKENCQRLLETIHETSKVRKLQQQFAKSPQLQRIQTELLDWKVRFPRIRAIWLASMPDIVTFQELDHAQDFLLDPQLSRHYTCIMSNDKDLLYRAARYKNVPGGPPHPEDELHPDNYLRFLLERRAAVAPKSYSTCRKLRWTRETQQQQEDNGTVSDHFEDDGVAIFWKKSRFQAVELGILQGLSKADDNKRSHATVAVTLQDISTNGKNVTVLTTHLPSGDSPEKERERLQRLQGGEAAEQEWRAQRIRFGRTSEPESYPVKFDGILSYARYFQGQKDHGEVIFALDSNSRPDFPCISTNTVASTNVWNELMSLTAAPRSWESIWIQDNYVDEVSGLSKVRGYPLIGSVNKMRGPWSSNQARKVGEHKLELIDHCLSTASVATLVRQVIVSDQSGLWRTRTRKVNLAPLLYATKASAELELIPSRTMPSDHLPVVVDLIFRHLG